MSVLAANQCWLWLLLITLLRPANSRIPASNRSLGKRLIDLSKSSCIVADKNLLNAHRTNPEANPLPKPAAASFRVTELPSSPKHTLEQKYPPRPPAASLGGTRPRVWSPPKSEVKRPGPDPIINPLHSFKELLDYWKMRELPRRSGESMDSNDKPMLLRSGPIHVDKLSPSVPERVSHFHHPTTHLLGRPNHRAAELSRDEVIERPLRFNHELHSLVKSTPQQASAAVNLPVVLEKADPTATVQLLKNVQEARPLTPNNLLPAIGREILPNQLSKSSHTESPSIPTMILHDLMELKHDPGLDPAYTVAVPSYLKRATRLVLEPTIAAGKDIIPESRPAQPERTRVLISVISNIWNKKPLSVAVLLIDQSLSRKKQASIQFFLDPEPHQRIAALFDALLKFQGASKKPIKGLQEDPAHKLNLPSARKLILFDSTHLPNQALFSAINLPAVHEKAEPTVTIQLLKNFQEARPLTPNTLLPAIGREILPNQLSKSSHTESRSIPAMTLHDLMKLKHDPGLDPAYTVAVPSYLKRATRLVLEPTIAAGKDIIPEFRPTQAERTQVLISVISNIWNKKPLSVAVLLIDQSLSRKKQASIQLLLDPELHQRIAALFDALLKFQGASKKTIKGLQEDPAHKLNLPSARKLVLFDSTHLPSQALFLTRKPPLLVSSPGATRVHSQFFQDLTERSARIYSEPPMTHAFRQHTIVNTLNTWSASSHKTVGQIIYQIRSLIKPLPHLEAPEQQTGKLHVEKFNMPAEKLGPVLRLYKEPLYLTWHGKMSLGGDLAVEQSSIARYSIAPPHQVYQPSVEVPEKPKPLPKSDQSHPIEVIRRPAAELINPPTEAPQELQKDTHHHDDPPGSKPSDNDVKSGNLQSMHAHDSLDPDYDEFKKLFPPEPRPKKSATKNGLLEWLTRLMNKLLQPLEQLKHFLNLEHLMRTSRPHI